MHDGYVVRARDVNSRTGKPEERIRRLDGVTLEQALTARIALAEEIRNPPAEEKRVRLVEFAALLTRRKIATKALASRSSQVQWAHVVDQHVVPAFGAHFVDSIRRADIEAWKEAQAALGVSPVTVNTRLRVLLTILRAAVTEYELGRDPTRGVKPLPTPHPYTDEEPNAMTEAEAAAFMAAARRLHPELHAFIALGLATGRRPSELRPLRRRGDSPDILWSEGVVLIRRSATRGVVMETTKTGRHVRVPLPPDLVALLRAHADGLRGAAKLSELLFPGPDGRMLPEHTLRQPFFAIAKAAGIRKTITPRAMRRTFQDLCRTAEVHDVVTRAISGHATETMQAHYSTASDDEVRGAVSRVAAALKLVP